MSTEVEAFLHRYGGEADTAARHTGVNRWTILAQWAVETGYGTSALAVNWHNLAGIRWYGQAGTVQIGGTKGKHGTGFAGYRTVDRFVTDYARVMALAPYDRVRHVQSVESQCRALGASPWDAGHYRRAGVIGGSLLDAWHVIKPPTPKPGTLPPPEAIGRRPAGCDTWVRAHNLHHLYRVRAARDALIGPYGHLTFDAWAGPAVVLHTPAGSATYRRIASGPHDGRYVHTADDGLTWHDVA